MTELEAINTLLGVIGEAPIDRLSDISTNEITDSALARRTLHEVSRDVQAEGWSWNTEQGVALQKDLQNQFPLDPATLAAVFSPNRYPDNRYVARGDRVYDRYERRFDFGEGMTGPLILDRLVVQLPWDQVPHAAQQYMTIRAARIYSDRYVNSNIIYTYTAQDEEYARSMLIRSEEQGGTNNLLWGNDRGIGAGLGFIPLEGTRFRSR